LRNFKPVCVALCLVHALCLSAMAQTSSTRITPEPPIGKGVVVLKAARLIDGTGAAPINNAVIVVTDNTITAVGTANGESPQCESKKARIKKRSRPRFPLNGCRAPCSPKTLD